MKKSKIVVALLGSLLLSQAAHATKGSYATLTWEGIIPGEISGDGFTVTGPGGGAIVGGDLHVEEDGSFESINDLVIEAHDVNSGTLAVESDLSSSEVTWKLQSVSVDSGGYDATSVEIEMNGAAVAQGASMTTLPDEGSVNIKAKYTSPADMSLLTPGEIIQVNATIYAEPV